MGKGMMGLVLGFIRNIFNDNERELKRLQPLMLRVNELEGKMAGLSDASRSLTVELKTAYRGDLGCPAPGGLPLCGTLAGLWYAPL